MTCPSLDSDLRCAFASSHATSLAGKLPYHSSIGSLSLELPINVSHFAKRTQAGTLNNGCTSHKSQYPVRRNLAAVFAFNEVLVLIRTENASWHYKAQLCLRICECCHQMGQEDCCKLHLSERFFVT